MNKKDYYKVFTKDLQSLGLKNNPNILTYTPNEWIYVEEVIEGIDDYGGIWVYSTLSNARKMVKYMLEKYDVSTRTFIVNIDQVLYHNSYRTKTNGIYLKEEILEIYSEKEIKKKLII